MLCRRSSRLAIRGKSPSVLSRSAILALPLSDDALAEHGFLPTKPVPAEGF
jgi:hypothetical protein